MSQGLALGITVGSSNTVAVTTSGGRRTVQPLPDALGGESELPESFLSRVGDPVDLRTRDGSAVRAADLVARAIGRAMTATGPAAATVACYPSWWPQHTVEVQRAALDAAGLDGVALVPEAAAAMRWLQEVHESSHDGAMAVYDLGATGLTVSVARTGSMSGLLGELVRTTTVAGAEFDLLTMRHVLAFAVGEKDFDPFDPLLEQELSALRGRCRIAKETLSKKTATMVPVRLPALGMDVRLVRDEVEDLYRSRLVASLDLVREAIRRAGLASGDLDGILLTGGGSAIPLVTELLSTEFGIPVATAADPAHLSTHGAALLAADLLADTTPTEPHAALSALPATRARHPERPNATPNTLARIDRDTNETDADEAADRPLPALPSEAARPSGFTHWRRAAVIGAAAIAVAALATGTLAMGTGAQPATSEPTAPQPASTTVAALDNAETPQSSGQAAPIGNPVVTAAPPGVTAPGSAPAAATGPTPGQPTTDPSTQPAAPGPSSPQQDPAAPAQLPAQPQPDVQAPSIPSLPTGALTDAVDQLGSAVPPVPSQILPQSGG
ncbi:Hsp70 family protein [Nocardia crassostreae]|uniref:Hsp70 family protein n=1 Tax=Nocardia crassostreae TaxID=53428 RepID=UPI00083131C2|nr:Hsp70 family protein [Nocardia crassostreae]